MSSPLRDDDSMLSILHAGLSSIIRLTGRKHRSVKQVCEDLIGRLQEEDRVYQASKQSTSQSTTSINLHDADPYFLPFKMACDTGDPKLISTALQSVERLIAYNYLDGSSVADPALYQPVTPSTNDQPTPVPSPSPNLSNNQSEPKSLITIIVDTLYQCASIKDRDVQLMVLKCISTLINQSSNQSNNQSFNQSTHPSNPPANRSSHPSPVKQSNIQIHGNSLVHTVLACWSIYQSSIDQTIKQSAKANLQSIYQRSFERMEKYGQQCQELEAINQSINLSTISSTEHSTSQSTDQSQLSKESVIHSTTADQSSEPQPTNETKEDVSVTEASNQLTAQPSDQSTSESGSESKEASEQSADQSTTQSTEATMPAQSDESSTHSPSQSTDQAPDQSISQPTSSEVSQTAARPPPGKRGYCIICSQPANYYCLQTHDPVCGMPCKVINLQNSQSGHQSGTQSNNQSANPYNNPSINQAVYLKIQSKFQISQDDCHRIFRTLIRICRRSVTQSTSQSTTASSASANSSTSQSSVESKILALELMLSTLKNPGPALKTQSMFVNTVKNELFAIILMGHDESINQSINHSITPSTYQSINQSINQSIFGLSSQLFVCLIKHFRYHLVNQIGLVIESIYQPIIQSVNSSFDHKMIGLLLIKSICSDPSIIVEVFINYDCQLNNQSIFEKICFTLEKVAQGGYFNQSASTQSLYQSINQTVYQTVDLSINQENRLKTVALEALIDIMKSLVYWTKQSPSESSNPTINQAISHVTGLIDKSTDQSVTESNGRTSPDSSVESTNQSVRASPSPSPSPSIESVSQVSTQSSPRDSMSMNQSINQSTYQSVRQKKLKLDSAILKFNDNPMKGICYLIDNQLIHQSNNQSIPSINLSTNPLGSPSNDTSLTQSGDPETHQFKSAKEFIDWVNKQSFSSLDPSINPSISPAVLQSIKTITHGIAQFFHRYKKTLNKTLIGDFMGDEKPISKKVLYEYVDQMDFTGESFDQSIRLFLSGFRLPGEAQKIDRMMEKFAQSYCVQNPTVLPSSEVAYIIGYSVIMLNTDLYNPNLKNHMTKAQYISNHRGIDNGKDIDPVLLGEMYDRIATEEIVLKDDSVGQSNSLSINRAIDPSTRVSNFVKESQQMVKRTQDILKTINQSINQSINPSSGTQSSNQSFEDSLLHTGPRDASVTQSSTKPSINDEWIKPSVEQSINCVQPMFEVLWYPSLATLSVILEENKDDDEESINESINQLNAINQSNDADQPINQSPTGSVFSQSLNQSIIQFNQTLNRSIALCLEGYQLGIRISNSVNLDVSRAAFVTSLKKFTLLGSINRSINQSTNPSTNPSINQSVSQLKGKNIYAILILLSIVQTEGNQLKDSWVDVLMCISELDRLQLIDRSINQTTNASTQSTNQAIIQSNNQAINRSINPSLIDRVFINSSNLSNDAIIDFVKALRQVSEYELGINQSANQASGSNNPSTNSSTNQSLNQSIREPRTFSLQKVVEITYYNMNRIRLIWSKIWSILSDLFVEAGCSTNQSISLYAIDSLRQLSMKFLEKDELTINPSINQSINQSSHHLSFQYQAQFMRPFESIMRINQSINSRELIVQCLSRMILARQKHIKSGWKSVLMVLSIAAKDTSANQSTSQSTNQSTASSPSNKARNQSINQSADQSNQQLIQSAGELVASIMENHFQLISENMEECVDCLISFADQSVNQSIALQSVHYLTLCATHMATNQSINQSLSQLGSLSRRSSLETSNEPTPSSTTAQSINQPASQANNHYTKVWFLLLTGLSRLASKSVDHSTTQSKQSNQPTAQSVQRLALETLFNILMENGSIFDTINWKLIFTGVIFPLFDDIRYMHQPVLNISVDPSSSLSSPAHRRDSVNQSSHPSDGDQPIDQSWIDHTCTFAFHESISLFTTYFHSTHQLLPELMDLITQTISQSNMQLAQIGIDGLMDLINQSSNQWTVSETWMVLQSINQLISQSLPTILLSDEMRAMLKLPAKQANNQSKQEESKTELANQSTIKLMFSAPLVATRCYIQQQLMHCLYELVTQCFPKRSTDSSPSRQSNSTTVPPITPSSHLRARSIHQSISQSINRSDTRVIGRLLPAHLLFTLTAFSRTLSFAHDFNIDVSLRRHLYAAGFHINQSVSPSSHQSNNQSANRLPQLFDLEALVTRYVFLILHRIWSEGGLEVINQSINQSVNPLDAQAVKSGHEIEMIDAKEADAIIAANQPLNLSPESSEDTALDQSINQSINQSTIDDYDSTVWICYHRLTSLVARLLKDYLARTAAGQFVSLEYVDEVIALIVDQYAALPYLLFAQEVDVLVPLFGELTKHGSGQVRAAVARWIQKCAFNMCKIAQQAMKKGSVDVPVNEL